MLLFRDLFLGFVKLHVLHHASQEPIYGLWLIEELGNHGYSLSPGTVYPMLHSLEASGLLASEEHVVAGKMRKYYAITRKGKAALAEARTRARALLDEIGDEGSDSGTT